MEPQLLPSEILFERPKSASDSIADTIKTAWLEEVGRWEVLWGRYSGGRRKGWAFLSFCMFLDEMFDVLCLIFADVPVFSLSRCSTSLKTCFTLF